MIGEIPRLFDVTVTRGEKWIFSAGFNVRADLGSVERVDAELADLRSLASAGARVAIVSHQGSYADRTAEPLDHIAAYLSEKLSTPVDYFPDCVGTNAENRARAMRDGELVLFGNTRLHAGEQRCDPAFARRLAALGDRVAIGGFSKAHRAHASNVGVLAFRPGFATRSLLSECELLAPWSGTAPHRSSIAVLGGQKPEKSTLGLAHLRHHYDVIIPGGAVLANLLYAAGYGIGSTSLGAKPDESLRAARAALAGPNRAEIHLPAEVFVISRRGGPSYPRELAMGIEDDEVIVDFSVEPWALERCRNARRALIAGPPSWCTRDERRATDALCAALPVSTTLRLGGDTASELPWSSPVSTGGGSALEFLALGRCAVVRALLEANRTQPSGPSVCERSPGGPSL